MTRDHAAAVASGNGHDMGPWRTSTIVYGKTAYCRRCGARLLAHGDGIVTGSALTDDCASRATWDYCTKPCSPAKNGG